MLCEKEVVELYKALEHGKIYHKVEKNAPAKKQKQKQISKHILTKTNRKCKR